MTQLGDGGATDAFYVWPSDGTDQSSNNAILNHLADFAGLSLDKIMVSQLGPDLSDVKFFTANMTGDAANRVANATEASSRV